MDEAIQGIVTSIGNSWGITLYALVVICISAILCGMLGLERERHGYAAGLRTHILVGIGAAVFTVLSVYAFGEFVVDETTGVVDWVADGDPARIAAQIIPGIGFIGAGSIMRDGFTIKGLTTAATLWVSAAIGMCAGAGMVSIAIIVTVVAILVLIGLKAVEARKHGKKITRITYLVPLGTKSLGAATACMDKFDVEISDVDIGTAHFNGDKCTRIILTLKFKDMSLLMQIMDELTSTIQPLGLEELS